MVLCPRIIKPEYGGILQVGGLVSETGVAPSYVML